MPAQNFYDKLKAELATDPLGRGYSSMTDEEVSADIHTEYRSELTPIPMSKVVRWCARHDALATLETAAASDIPALRSVARAALVMISSPHIAEFNVHDSELAAMFDALVSSGVFTADERADLVALGTKNTSRAAELGLGRVKVGYVGKARSQGE